MAHECSHGLPALGYRECYCGLKDRLRAGQVLTAEELEYVGFAPSTRAPAGGWHDVNIGLPSLELSPWEVDTQTASDIAILMSVGTRRDGWLQLG